MFQGVERGNVIFVGFWNEVREMCIFNLQSLILIYSKIMMARKKHFDFLENSCIGTYIYDTVS